MPLRWKLSWRMFHTPFGHFLGVAVVSLLLGFWVTRHGPFMWDDMVRYFHSRSLLGAYHITGDTFFEHTRYYAPLWELILGLSSELYFGWLHDPFWVRHAFTFALLPLGLYTLYRLLRRAGISTAGSLLCISCMIGIIRFGGHALFNVKDFVGAMAYLVVSVWTWVLLQEGLRRKFSHSLLVKLGIISVLPFLVRSPLLPHFGLTLCALGIIALRHKHLSLRRRVSIIGIPFLAGLLFTIVVSPAFWTFDIREWIKPLLFFADYPNWNGYTRIFGVAMNAEKLPLWYAPAWIPVIAHPVVLFLSVIGVYLGIRHRRTIGHHARVPLLSWLWLLTGLSWAIVLLVHPKLYDEERHVLFLYPLLFLTCTVGLDVLKKEWKYICTATVLFLSCTSYLHWGQFSYVYKSPLVSIEPGDYLGDYWSTCAGNAVKAMKDRVPPGTGLEVIGSPAVAYITLERAKTSLFWSDPALQNYHYEPNKVPEELPYARIAYNRDNMLQTTLQDVKQGKATLLWEQQMPPGEPACVLVLVTKH